MSEALTSAQKKKLKALAQRLDAHLKLGKAGISDTFVASLEAALSLHELVKVRFSDFKEERKNSAPELAAKTSSHLVTLIGNVAVLYRQQPDAEKRKIRL